MALLENSIIKRYEKWLRVVGLVHFAGKKICHDLLHTKEGLPTDGEDLYIYLSFHKQYINPEKFQSELLYPPNEITDESKFDITLYTRVIHGLYGTKYKRLLDDLRNLRNTEFHKGNIDLTEAEFKELWEKASNILESHDFDMNLVTELRDCGFSQLHKYSEALLDCIQDCIKGIVKIFTFSYPIFCISACYYFLCSDNMSIFLHFGTVNFQHVLPPESF